jgi:hypothetical protein
MAGITVDLDEAERGGVISPGQAAALRRASNPEVHDEPVEVANRFSEVFVAIGCTILISGLHAILMGQKFSLLSVYLVHVVVAWGLAELVYRRRMTFATGFCVLLAAWAAHGAAGAITAPNAPSGSGYRGFANGRSVTELTVILATSAAVLGAGLARFRIPFLVLPTVVMGAVLLIANLGGRGQIGSLPFLAAVGVAGACLLATGAWADRQDPERKGKPSQYAFWLFVAGSPMTVHPFLILCLTQMKGVNPSFVAAVVIALSLAVTFVGLVLDRRAPVVSTLVYVTVAVGYLLMSPGIATLMIGFYVLALGVFWKSAQTMVAGAVGRRPPPVVSGEQPTGGLRF